MNNQINLHAVVGIDPGEKQSGVALVAGRDIVFGKNVPNKELMPLIQSIKHQYAEVTIIIEDMLPYNMRITNNIIRSIKAIGQLELRLQDAGFAYYLAPRWWIKQWVYDEFKDVAMPRILKKMEYTKSRIEKQGGMIKKMSPTFAYVDDWIVVRSMKKWWKIPNANVHNKNKYGLKDHSWQALALITFSFARECFFSRQSPATF
jgi:hypothetical protein